MLNKYPGHFSKTSNKLLSSLQWQKKKNNIVMGSAMLEETEEQEQTIWKEVTSWDMFRTTAGTDTKIYQV